MTRTLPDGPRRVREGRGEFLKGGTDRGCYRKNSRQDERHEERRSPGNVYVKDEGEYRREDGRGSCHGTGIVGESFIDTLLTTLLVTLDW